MMQLVNTKEVTDDNKEKMTSTPQPTENLSIEQCIAAAIAHHPTSQLLLSSHFITHHQEAGLNPLVDAGAKLFSVMGRLRYIKSHHHLEELHRELVRDIQHFQKTIETSHYPAEYIAEYLPLATYTVCVTLDDIISKMPWANQGKWDAHQLLAAFNQERLTNQNFLIILERLVRDPAVYIDVMEFMYICLSLGFKCHFNSTEGDQEQLQQITHSLYKRIRRERGNFNKTLSPFQIKARAKTNTFSWKQVPPWLIMIFIASLLTLLFIIGEYLLNISFHHTTKTIAHMERTLHEKNHE